jgi:hypothetical protein
MRQQLFTLPDHPLVVIVWYLAFFVKLCRSLLAILSLLYVDHGIVFPSFIGVFWSLLWYIQPFIYIRGGSVSIISVVFNSVLFQLTVLINWTCYFQIVYVFRFAVDYVGCYRDDKKRLLKHRGKALQDNSLESCRKHCKGFKYLGLQVYMLYVEGVQ